MDTIIVELVHYWFPDLKHYSQFQQMKKALLKGKIPYKDFKIEATLKIPIEQQGRAPTYGVYRKRRHSNKKNRVMERICR
jgi:hypothetical protein